MPSSIWTRCAGHREIFRLDARPWRVVERHHEVSTRKLVDSAAEHRRLEELLTSDPAPGSAEELPPTHHLHPLLATPFRRPPLRHGSRFGGRFEPGIWYGAELRTTALAEAAYYRFVFLAGTEARLEATRVDLSAFQVKAGSDHGVDLTAPAFQDHRELLTSPTDYRATQQLGSAMRQAGVEIFRYTSARDPMGAPCIGLFSPRAILETRPSEPETWSCLTSPTVVEMTRRSYFQQDTLRFPRTDFEVDGTLPTPAA